MNTQPTLYDMRSLITADHAAKPKTKFDLECLLAELNNGLQDNGEEQLDPLFALPLLTNALKRLHQIHEKKRLAFTALEIARNLLTDFAQDAFSSQEDGGALCDTAVDWCVIQNTDDIGQDAEMAEYIASDIDEKIVV